MADGSDETAWAQATTSAKQERLLQGVEQNTEIHILNEICEEKLTMIKIISIIQVCKFAEGDNINKLY